MLTLLLGARDEAPKLRRSYRRRRQILHVSTEDFWAMRRNVNSRGNKMTETSSTLYFSRTLKAKSRKKYSSALYFTLPLSRMFAVLPFICLATIACYENKRNSIVSPRKFTRILYPRDDSCESFLHSWDPTSLACIFLHLSPRTKITRPIQDQGNSCSNEFYIALYRNTANVQLVNIYKERVCTNEVSFFFLFLKRFSQ